MKLLVPSTQKLVPFLQGELGAYSGKMIRKILEANLCRVNGRVERFGSSQVKRGDAVELAPSWKSILTPKLTKFETILEHEAFLIVSKPAGWVCTDSEARKVFGPDHYLVHRLDKDTTGLLIIAKGIRARDQLMELFEKREVKKRYLTLVDGLPREDEGVRSSLLGKKGSFQGQTIWGSCSQGLSGITKWKVLSRGKMASLIQCEPETGRTHQIRVHMAEMGHPILIDRQYAKQFRSSLFVQRPLLHAHALEFIFELQKIEAVSPLPKDFLASLQACGCATSW